MNLDGLLFTAKTKTLTISELHGVQLLIFMYKHNRGPLLPDGFANMFALCTSIIAFDTSANDGGNYIRPSRLSSML